MAVNKVIFGNNTLIDLTSDTVTAADLAVGVTAHAASGAAITGTKKEPGYITLSTHMVTLDAEHMTATVDITSVSGQILDVHTFDSTVATVSFNSSYNRITITSTGKAGTVHIGIAVNSTPVYDYINDFIYVTADFPALQTVSWASGSDDQIAAMVTADRNGDIDLRDYWDVGDERTVVLSSIAQYSSLGDAQPIQPITFVLLHKGGDNDDYRFIVGTKECLSELGKMNTLNSATKWSATPRCTWCDDCFRPAIPQTFRSIFKQWTVYMSQKNSSATASADAYFAIAAQTEIFGGTVTGESSLFQFDYYKTAANRIKTAGVNGAACAHWTRMKDTGNNIFFHSVSAAGDVVTNSMPSSLLGIAPIGRI